MDTLVKSVEAAAKAAEIDERDRATLNLALTYAAEIDNEGDLAKLGPALLAALEALQLSPRARAAAVKGKADDKPAGSKLDELRERRARKSRAPDLDTAAT